MSDVVLRYVLLAWLVMAVAVFTSLFFVNAPYGRYFGGGAGPALKARIGWILMEAPAPLVFAAAFLAGFQTVTVTQVVFLIMWEAHYIDRAFIYPVRLRISSRPLPVTVMGAGIVFNLMNAYLNGSYIIANTARYPAGWLTDIRFLAGLVIAIAGFAINRNSDLILYRLRSESPGEYGVPQGGLFRWVSCPNYLGEILIWIGWTIATWSPVAAAFAVWTIANLAPRARSHHSWYRRQFADYPEERHALIPRLW
jgi:3-oxo-5-alpha-steroid 4-dehydrogenase 1